MLEDLSVGAATKGGVLERAMRCAREDLLPALADDVDWIQITDLVAASAHTVKEHGLTLAG